MKHKTLIKIAAAALLSIFVLDNIWSWHKAGVQVAVYKRQGIEMTQWECFVGAEPAVARRILD